MPNKSYSRRGFMVGCSTAIAAMAGAKLNYVAFGSPAAEPNQEILVVIFLRGACDCLNFVVPKAGPDRGIYYTKRGGSGGFNLALEESSLLDLGAGGSLAAYAGTNDDPPGSAIEFGLHPAAAPLQDLFQANRLAMVHATGLDYDNRSHFDMMEFMERGTPGQKSTASGWLTRHLATAPNLPSQIIAPAMAMGNLTPSSLLSSREAMTVSNFGDFKLNTGHPTWRNSQQVVLRQMYSADNSWLHQAGVQTLDAVDVLQGLNTGGYTPAGGAVYPMNGFGDHLKSIAQMIKFQLGMQIATVDLGGWDTHEYQGDKDGGYFATLLGTLANGLNAFYTDLDADGYGPRVTVVVMSEFGRKLIMNGSRGTDHGHGSLMLVLGGSVNGGKIYGSWPGLDADQEQLYAGRDLRITTDYRQVLSEILIRRLENPNLGTIFPNYTGYAPLGIVQGTDLEPIYGSANAVYLPLVIK